MKKLMLVIVLLHNLYALDSMSSIPEEQKNLVASIVKVLELPANAENKKTVFNRLDGFLTDGWSAHWTKNNTGKTSKLGNSQTQICDVTIYNNDRVVNCTFVHFKKEKQVFVTVKQYVSVKSSRAIELYNERKADSKYTVENETDNYAYFNNKGYMDYVTYHVTAPVGMVIYESSYFIDVK